MNPQAVQPAGPELAAEQGSAQAPASAVSSAQAPEPAVIPSSDRGTASSSARSQWIGWIRYFILLGLGLFLLLSTIGLDRVSGHSMAPTLGDGNIILVNKLSTYFSQPDAGDVVIVKSAALGYAIVKRVIGTEGDAVAIQGGTVYVNGQPVPELYTTGQSMDMAEEVVRPGHVFVLGDNREPGESLDSRSQELGQVPLKEIQGYAWVSLLPLKGIAKQLKGI